MLSEDELNRIKESWKTRGLEMGLKDEETISMAKLKLGEVYEGLIQLINKYMDIQEDKAKLVAIWIIGTYFHSSFNAYPYLFINAMRGSGKTRLLKIIAYLSRNSFGRVQSGITESVLFRMPTGYTLVLDELEQIGGKDKQALREYMNASYKRGGAVGRSKKVKIDGKEEWITDYFEPYKPIAMANIWGMDEVLGDRCISFVLEKSSNPAKTKKAEDFDTNPTFKVLNELLTHVSAVSVVLLRKKNYTTAWNDYIERKYNDIYTLTTLITQITQITQKEKNDDEKRREIIEKEELIEMFNKIDNLGVDGRNLELLMPLLLIAKMISEEVFDEMLKIGKDMMQNKKEDEFAESRDVSLYEFVSKQESDLNYKPIKQLTTMFKTWLGSEDEWINEKWFGRALKRLNLALDSKRQASGKHVQLNVAKAKEKIKMFKGVDG